jgi:acetyl-CoA carboxylase carboxyltransferase subunit alpha
MLDRVTPRGQMRTELITILRMLLNLPPAVTADLPAPELPVEEDSQTATQPDTVEEQTADTSDK